MKKNVLALSLVTVGLLATTTVFAQVATGDSVVGAALKARKSQSIATCEIIGKNLDKRISNFERNKTKKVAQYTTIQKKLTKLITRMENEGYDTAAVRVSLVTLDQKIAKFESDYDVYLKDLSDTKEFTCKRSEGEFRAKLDIARAQLKLAQQDAVDIRTYWAKTVKPQIEAVKAPTVEESATTTEGGTI